VVPIIPASPYAMKEMRNETMRDAPTAPTSDQSTGTVATLSPGQGYAHERKHDLDLGFHLGDDFSPRGPGLGS